MIGLTIPGYAAEFAEPSWAADGADPREVNAWVVVEPDETVILRCPMAEMGQGTGTGLPMLLAEELECDWSKVKVEFSSVNRNIREHGIYGDQVTAGSRGIRTTWPYVQQAGASARARLIQAAAKKWKVPASECSAAMSKVTHRASGRSLGYGALVADAAKMKLASEPAIKTPEQFKFAGTRQPRLDSAIKSNGAAKFGIDTREPGQLYASIMTCPVFGGKLVSVDDSGVRNARGVKQVVKLDDAVAVVADNYWRANQALTKLKPVWDGGEAAHTDSAQFARDYREALDGPLVAARNDGDAKAAIAKSQHVVTAEYETPLLAHATMEPCNATVHLQKDRLDIWMGSQSALGNAKYGGRGSRAQARAGLFPPDVSGRRLRPAHLWRRTCSRHPGGQGGQHRRAAAIAVVARRGYAQRPLSAAIGDTAEGGADARRQAGRALHPERLRLDPALHRPPGEGRDRFHRPGRHRTFGAL